MVYFDNISKRAREKQLKEGISYPQKDGKLYNTFKWFYILSFAFSAVMNLMYIIGIALFINEDARFADDIGKVIVIAVCTVLMTVALIISKHNAKPIFASIFGVVNVGSAVTLIFMFMNMMKDNTVAGGVSLNFYWRHLAPLVIVAICAIIMATITIIAYFKTQKAYNKVLEIVYDEYNSLNDSDKPEWEEYVKNYKF